ncbi:MAG: Ppx/GppA family phosphatase [Burkholderiaceae bacterium]|nr:Ppx/GppA family phosphatase [Burkholderiaceae bacterium]
MLLAAVDLGSNSFRLEIGRVEGTQILRQNYWKEPVRLAAGLDEHNRLTRRAIEAACECLARMNERLRDMPPSQVRAVGTHTLRSAVNVNEFLLEGQAALGFPIDVISGREEARLVFEGCMHTLPPSEARRLVVDIGGGSTEIIVGRGFAAEDAESFRVGCASVSLRYFREGVLERGALRRATVAAAAQFEEAVARFSRKNWDEAYGTGGTIEAVSAILRAQEWTDGTITTEGLLRLRQALLAAGETRRLKLAGLKPERLDVIAGGVAVLAAVFDTLGIVEMQTARGALRVGLLYDLLGRREDRDVRDASVERLQTRFGVDRAQAARVAAVARSLHAALTQGGDADAAKRLAWAAALHEVGFAISHDDYHKHGAYLLTHAELPGFSTADQQRLAQLVLGQRGNLKKVTAALEGEDRGAAVFALRLAVIFCHARRDVALPRWELRRTRHGVELALAADWLAAHPLTHHLLEEEAEHWERAGLRLALRELP